MWDSFTFSMSPMTIDCFSLPDNIHTSTNNCYKINMSANTTPVKEQHKTVRMAETDTLTVSSLINL